MNEILFNAVFQVIAEAVGVSSEDARELLTDVQKFSPEILAVAESPCAKKILMPPSAHCILGCKNSYGEPSATVRHYAPKTRALYGIGTLQHPVEYTLRCTKCQGRFSYSLLFDSGKNCYQFYEEPRDYVFVNARVYWTRDLSILLINSMYVAE